MVLYSMHEGEDSAQENGGPGVCDGEHSGVAHSGLGGAALTFGEPIPSVAFCQGHDFGDYYGSHTSEGQQALLTQ